MLTMECSFYFIDSTKTSLFFLSSWMGRKISSVFLTRLIKTGRVVMYLFQTRKYVKYNESKSLGSREMASQNQFTYTTRRLEE